MTPDRKKKLRVSLHSVRSPNFLNIITILFIFLFFFTRIFVCSIFSEISFQIIPLEITILFSEIRRSNEYTFACTLTVVAA